MKERLLSGQAWDEFCDRLKASGRRLLEDEFPDSPREVAEGYRHLARLTLIGLQWGVEFQDPEFPRFLRFEDDVTKVGGPNPDNTYLRAKIRGDGRYRIRGRLDGLRDLIISTPEGDMQLEQYGVFAKLDASEIQADPDGNFEIVISAEREPGNWMPLHPDADHVMIRQFFSDWERDAPTEFDIERLDREELLPEPVAPGPLAERLDFAGEWIERSLVYWNRYTAEIREQVGANRFAPPANAEGGERDILYGNGFFQLEDDQALIVETEPPDGRYWSFQLYTTAWLESLDFAHRLTGLNDSQARLDSDGRFRAVIAHRDPGVWNWLDTTGLREGMLIYRWVWSNTAPTPSARLVPFDALREHLPPDTPPVDREQRRAQLESRRRGIVRRFRR